MTHYNAIKKCKLYAIKTINMIGPIKRPYVMIINFNDLSWWTGKVPATCLSRFPTNDLKKLCDR